MGRYEIFQFISVVAIMTNVAIVAYTSNVLTSPKVFGLSWDSAVIISVVVEHLLLVFKFLLNQNVGSTPSWVKKTRALQKLKVEEYERLVVQIEAGSGYVPIRRNYKRQVRSRDVCMHACMHACMGLRAHPSQLQAAVRVRRRPVREHPLG